MLSNRVDANIIENIFSFVNREICFLQSYDLMFIFRLISGLFLWNDNRSNHIKILFG